jgi:hypothetical protein
MIFLPGLRKWRCAEQQTSSSFLPLQQVTIVYTGLVKIVHESSGVVAIIVLLRMFTQQNRVAIPAIDRFDRN